MEIIIEDLFTYETLLLCLVSLCAGFIDSIVGGGGLLQTPAMLVILPQYPIATLFGTTKIPSLTGTAFSAYRFSKRVEVDWKLLLPIAALAFGGALLGAHAITLVSGAGIKPVILVLLIAIAIYTYSRKDLGLHSQQTRTKINQLIIGLVFGFAIGFYDGMIGPGTGTFLLLAFVSLIGYDFLQATTSAKYINVATNIAAMLYFAQSGHILYQYAIPMAVFNLLGAFLGVKLALLKGNSFVRIFFLIIVGITILRFSWDVFVK
ncbi:TSUP family transporter [Flavobacterium sp. HSC-61S13]|uniref:sulfite exporter TauE/SafE family protein n=1 Tax=Flavobacterium sp. HSC-61S13 TaxID=2910963 RepID=UPI0020A05537|nr:TSUP family transporter [Flavobacterium sp. HSC-61S13]MCP1996322.1 putative membrane protein YfcA [Flavobacterium sp. HSC-61S13]